MAPGVCLVRPALLMSPLLTTATTPCDSADDSVAPSLGGRIEGITCARKARPAILVRPRLSVTATPTVLAFVVLYATMVFSLTLPALILLSSQLRAGCWLRYRWDQYGESCCPACVVDGALPPALHGVPQLALARPRPVGSWCRVKTGAQSGKRGIAQVRWLA